MNKESAGVFAQALWDTGDLRDASKAVDCSYHTAMKRLAGMGLKVKKVLVDRDGNLILPASLTPTTKDS